jgi:hypothetical protein
MKRAKMAAALAAASAIGLGALALAGPGETEKRAPQPDMGAHLMAGLRQTEGCLGVDAGQFMSGKNAIIAWFENKAAVQRWYHSEVHLGVMRMAMPEQFAEMEHTPLEHVTDEDAPVMVVASITFVDRPMIEGMNLPVSQLAIELYTPLPGGAFINGRLAPESLKVPHMKGYSDREPEHGG